MEDYLTRTSLNLKTTNYCNLNIVIGNESCDLDSAVCTLVYAAFLDWQYNQIKCKVCTRTKRAEAEAVAQQPSKNEVFVPLLNVNRNDLPLKTEVKYCFGEHGIDINLLVCRDDYDFEALLEQFKSKCTVTLVDHHVLAKRDLFLTPFVTEIVDHRTTDKSQWLFKNDTRCTIELVGSCSTLIINRIRTLVRLLGKGDFLTDYYVCAKLLHSCIILDTVNFSKEVNKGTSEDEEAVSYLESVFKPENYVDDRKIKLEQLSKARRDVSTMTVAELMRKDVKIVRDVMVPSFPILVEKFLKRQSAIVDIMEVLKSQDCSIALLLGMSTDDEPARDTAIMGWDEEKIVQFMKLLEGWDRPSLHLELTKLPDQQLIEPGVCFVYYIQKYIKASRKQYMPIVNQFLGINNVSS